MTELNYRVDGMSCGHCRLAIAEELRQLPEVEDVEVDLASKRVSVRGSELDDRALRAAIANAGYHAEA